MTSNYDRNLRLAELVALSTGQRVDVYGLTVSLQTLDNIGKELITYRTVDYCNNWNDLMNLVIQHGISLEYDKVYPEELAEDCNWNAYQGESESPYEIYVTNTNPQIALVDCLISVLEAKESK